MIDHQRNMTPVVGLTLKMRTGAERMPRPVYIGFLPPCNNACPAGEKIQAVHGRGCYHPCETRGSRRELEGAVSIHAVEHFLGNLVLGNGWKHEHDDSAR